MNNKSLTTVVANAKAKPARAASMDEKTAMRATQPITKLERTLKREEIHRFTVKMFVILVVEVGDQAHLPTSSSTG